MDVAVQISTSNSVLTVHSVVFEITEENAKLGKNLRKKKMKIILEYNGNKKNILEHFRNLGGSVVVAILQL